MSDFDFQMNDLIDSRSITAKVKQGYYPNNQQIIQNTSDSQEDNYDRTLMSRDVVKIMQGDAISRNPAYVTAVYEQNARSTMHTILSMGADIDDTVKIPDPEDPTNFLTGAAARAELARKSILSTGIAPSGFSSALTAFASGYNSESINGKMTAENGTGSMDHSTDNYETSGSAQVYNNINRSIAFWDQLSDEEKQEYNKKTTKLLSKSNFDISDRSIMANGFYINFSTNSKGQDLKSLNFELKQSGSYIESGTGYQFKTDVIPKETLGTGVKRCMPSAALIELLTRLCDSIYILGGLDTSRGIIGKNYSALTADNNSVSDHAFGRGFDIFSVGLSKDSAISVNPVVPAQQYMKALDVLLQYIQQLPQELHPDLIMVSDALKNDLGITDNLEGNDSAFRKKYPNLAKFVNIGCDANHTNHIHISFGSQRAGSILSPSQILVQQNGITTPESAVVYRSYIWRTRKV